MVIFFRLKASRRAENKFMQKYVHSVKGRRNLNPLRSGAVTAIHAASCSRITDPNSLLNIQATVPKLVIF